MGLSKGTQKVLVASLDNNYAFDWRDADILRWYGCCAIYIFNVLSIKNVSNIIINDMIIMIMIMKV